MEGAGSPPQFSAGPGSVRDAADGQMRSLRRREGRARGPGPPHSCPSAEPNAGLSDTGESVLENGLPQVQRLAPRGTGRGVHKEEAGPLPAPTPDSNSGHLEQDSFS